MLPRVQDVEGGARLQEFQPVRVATLRSTDSWGQGGAGVNVASPEHDATKGGHRQALETGSGMFLPWAASFDHLRHLFDGEGDDDDILLRITIRYAGSSRGTEIAASRHTKMPHGMLYVP
jgi:hypothetical protein